MNIKEKVLEDGGRNADGFRSKYRNKIVRQKDASLNGTKEGDWSKSHDVMRKILNLL
jgi:hypothetical protein